MDMKIAHLSDLHLGKRLKEYSLIEDQKYILRQIIDILKQEKVTTVLLAGDIYDTGNPSSEAVALLSMFLLELKNLGIHVMMIAGNHDNGTRLSYGAEIFADSDIHITGKYTGKLACNTIEDEYGPVHFFSLPYIRPIYVNQYLDETEAVEGYTAAVKHALQTVKLNQKERNIILSHQFITGTVTDEQGSEVSVGGTDNVDGNVFRDFDYVARGHIHRPQTILRDTMRYCGTPLKYSIGEANTTKSVTIIDMKEKGNTTVYTVDLKPLRDVVVIKDTFANILQRKNTENDDYVYFQLQDEHMVFDAMNTLRLRYPNILGISYPNSAYEQSEQGISYTKQKNQTPQEIFGDFFAQYTGHTLDDTQEKILDELVTRIWKEGDEE